jgi:DNA-binding CsgD family transcriptional regulator
MRHRDYQSDGAARFPTPQQVRVLMMLSEGLLNKQIAYELGVSEATVKAHVSAILQKLGVESRTQAVITAAKIEVGQWSQGDAGLDGERLICVSCLINLTRPGCIISRRGTTVARCVFIGYFRIRVGIEDFPEAPATFAERLPQASLLWATTRGYGTNVQRLLPDRGRQSRHIASQQR